MSTTIAPPSHYQLRAELSAVGRDSINDGTTDINAAQAYWRASLCHGFHDGKQGLRFTISEPARREVLQRLLKLNHERYSEEVRQGLHGKKSAAGRVASGGKKAASGGKAAAKKPDATESKKRPSLFGEDTDE
jgi:hypothetical protein